MTASDLPQIDWIEFETGSNPKHTVIWLHGLGADGHDFETVVPELGLAAAPATRFIFPHAPMRPITVNGGMMMRGWYDIDALPLDTQREDRAGLEQAMAMVEQLIAGENARGVATANILLAGFSQGGAVALFAGLRLASPPAALIALSTYLPVAASTKAERAAASHRVPIFMAHGVADPIVPLAIGEQSYRTLLELGYRVDWHTYDMPHAVHPQEIRDLGAFIRATIAG